MNIRSDRRYAEESDFQTPLDEVDAAARITGEIAMNSL